MTQEDELLDLVDKNDKVIGTIWRSKTADPFKGYLRAAELLIINDEGKLWVPRRQMHKRIAPGGLDFSASGHVASGEGYEETLYRETEEELNLKLDPKKLELLHKFPPHPDLPPYFRTVYIYHSNDVPEYNPDDFSGYEWLTPQEVAARLEAGEPGKASILETVKFLINKH